MYKQNFIPASKGMIKSAPSSLIPDGAFQETMNVRFGDGYVEKVQGFRLFNTDSGGNLDNSIMYIGQYITDDSQAHTVVHTRDGVYCINDGYQYDSEDIGYDNYHGSPDPDDPNYNPNYDPENPDDDDDQIQYIITITQSAHQTIIVTNYRGNTKLTHQQGFRVKGSGWKIYAIVRPDPGYIAGSLNISGEVTVDQNLSIYATPAQEIQYSSNDKTFTYYIGGMENTFGSTRVYWDEQLTQVIGNVTDEERYNQRPLGRVYCNFIDQYYKLYGQSTYRRWGVFSGGITGYWGKVIPDCTDLVQDLNLLGCTSIKHLLDTRYCQWIENADFSNLNLETVESIEGFINGSPEYLKSIGDISHWDTSHLINLNGLVPTVSENFQSLDLSGWNTSNLELAWNVFTGNQAKILDISNWDTTKLRGFSFSNSVEYLIMDKEEVKFSDEYMFKIYGSFSINGLNQSADHRGCKFLVPSAMVEEYRQHPNWSAYASQIDSVDNYIITRSNGKITVVPIAEE